MVTVYVGYWIAPFLQKRTVPLNDNLISCSYTKFIQFLIYSILTKSKTEVVPSHARLFLRNSKNAYPVKSAISLSYNRSIV